MPQFWDIFLEKLTKTILFVTRGVNGWTSTNKQNMASFIASHTQPGKKEERERKKEREKKRER